MGVYVSIRRWYKSFGMVWLKKWADFLMVINQLMWNRISIIQVASKWMLENWQNIVATTEHFTLKWIEDYWQTFSGWLRSEGGKGKQAIFPGNIIETKLQRKQFICQSICGIYISIIHEAHFRGKQIGKMAYLSRHNESLLLANN